jgi:hypothetical protein
VIPHRLKHGTKSAVFHAKLKAEPQLWERLTIPVGVMPDGDGGVLALANCRVCMSTLARPMKVER